MKKATHSSTLLRAERSLRPFVLVGTGICSSVALLALVWSLPRVALPLWLAAAGLALAPAASNLHYLHTHTMPTFGMLPVALFSLIPALACVLETPDAPALLRIAFAFAECLLLATAALLCWWFWRLWRTYATRPAIAADAALIVLGGAIKRGRPCQTLARRLDVALHLVQEQPGRLVVVTGGPTPDGRTTEAHEMARYLLARGVARSAILIEPAARNTKENILHSCALLDELGFGGQRCVVSSDYHLWRALHEAESLGVSLVPIAAPTPAASIPQQWCREVLTILFGR